MIDDRPVHFVDTRTGNAQELIFIAFAELVDIEMFDYRVAGD